jgi:hypothetical protein
MTKYQAVEVIASLGHLVSRVEELEPHGLSQEQQYLLRAFLQFNTSWRVVWSAY